MQFRTTITTKKQDILFIVTFLQISFRLRRWIGSGKSQETKWKMSTQYRLVPTSRMGGAIFPDP